MPNLHSHAFQRAMAGLAEHASPGGKRGDSFWTWREVMYRFVARLPPAQIEAVSAQLYVEMLQAGYTAVGQFHSHHPGPDGPPYDGLGAFPCRPIAPTAVTGLSHTPLQVTSR